MDQSPNKTKPAVRHSVKVSRPLLSQIMKTITLHRKPTESEVKFGYGATHFKDFPVSEVSHPNGKFKRTHRCKEDGLVYTPGKDPIAFTTSN